MRSPQHVQRNQRIRSPKAVGNGTAELIVAEIPDMRPQEVWNCDSAVPSRLRLCALILSFSRQSTTLPIADYKAQLRSYNSSMLPSPPQHVQRSQRIRSPQAIGNGTTELVVVEIPDPWHSHRKNDIVTGSCRAKYDCVLLSSQLELLAINSIILTPEHDIENCGSQNTTSITHKILSCSPGIQECYQ